MKASIKNHGTLRRYGENLFGFDSILNSFFSKSIDFYNPILIPPKRRLEFKSNIDMTQEISPNGDGIINKLFFLKTRP